MINILPYQRFSFLIHHIIWLNHIYEEQILSLNSFFKVEAAGHGMKFDCLLMSGMIVLYIH
jgi:hypothetical protein